MPAEENRNWYETPLYYDIVFAEDTEKEADFLETMHRRHGRGASEAKPGAVLEPACGSGRLVAAMAHRRWTVSGFDLSPEMHDFARERLRAEGLKATLWEDRMESFAVPGTKKPAPRFDLAHCLVSTFKYLPTEAAAAACLRGVAAHLKCGGLFVLGVHLTDYANEKILRERWVGARRGTRVVCNTRTWPADRKTRVERLRTRLQITRGGRTRIQETHWQFRSYNAAQMRALLKKAPEFELVACYDFTYNPGETRRLDDEYSDIVLILRRV